MSRVHRDWRKTRAYAFCLLFRRQLYFGFLLFPPKQLKNEIRLEGGRLINFLLFADGHAQFAQHGDLGGAEGDVFEVGR